MHKKSILKFSSTNLFLFTVVNPKKSTGTCSCGNQFMVSEASVDESF